MRFVVSTQGHIVTDDGETSEDIERWLDETMEELLNLGASDATIDADLGARQVSFSALVDAANPIGAISQVSGLLRTAIHAAGGGTPDWPDALDGAWGIRLVGVSAGEVVSTDDATDEDEKELAGV